MEQRNEGCSLVNKQVEEWSEGIKKDMREKKEERIQIG